jgi:membrane protein implicated in regulation of membrane protease activity
MGNLKTILTLIAVILGLILGFAVIGMVITALQYLFWLGVLCLAAVVTVKLLKKSNSAQLESKDNLKALKEAERSVEEYKRKYLPK